MTDKQAAFILKLTNEISGKAFMFFTQGPKTIARLSDGLVSEDAARHMDLTVAQASALINLLKVKAEAIR